MSMVDKLAKMYRTEFNRTYDKAWKEVSDAMNEAKSKIFNRHKNNIMTVIERFLKSEYGDEIKCEVKDGWGDTFTINIDLSKILNSTETVRTLVEIRQKLSEVKKSFNMKLEEWMKDSYERRLAKQEIDPLEFDYGVFEEIKTMVQKVRGGEQ